MQHPDFQFVDRTGTPADPLKLIAPVVIPKEAIEAEVERLASLPAPANGRRVSMVANPHTGVGNGFTPGTAVSLCVLKPGEQTKPIRHNSALVNFCIRGAGQTRIDGKCIRYEQYDVWNTPAWAVYEHLNDTQDLQVRLTYSNSALLEKMQVHIVDENPPVNGATKEEGGAHAHVQNPFGTFPLTSVAAFLMPYEKFINPVLAHHGALFLQWQKDNA